MPSKGARRTVFATVARASATADSARETFGSSRPAGRLGALGLARRLVEEVGRDDSLTGEAPDPLALPLGPVRGEAGLVALGARPWRDRPRQP